MIWNLLHESLKAVTLGTISCPQRIRNTKERQLTGDQIRPFHHERAMTASGSVRKVFKTALQQVYNVKVDVIAGDAIATAYIFPDGKSTKICMLREMQREAITWDAHVRADFILILIVILTVASWHCSHGKKHLDPESCETSGATRVSKLRVTKKKSEDSSYTKGIEALLRETARKGYPDPEEVNNPMIAPQDQDHPRSGRPERTRSKKPRNRTLRNIKWNSGRWKSSSWTWNTSPSSSAWQE